MEYLLYGLAANETRDYMETLLLVTDDNKINWFEVLTLLIAFASIAIVLFLSEV